DGTGDPVVGSGATPVDSPEPRGISTAPGIAAPSAHLFWPDARIVHNGRTQLAILNPNAEADAELELSVGFSEPDLYAAIAPIRISVPAGQERVVDLTDNSEFLHGMELTLDLWSTEGVPVVAELVWFTPDREAQELPTEEDPDAGTGSSGDGELSPEEQAAAEEASASEAEGAATGDGEGSPEAGEGEEDHDHDGVGDGPGFTIYAPGVSVTAGSPVGARSWFVAGTGASS